MRKRLEVLEHNAKSELGQDGDKTRVGDWYNRYAAVPNPPIFIATTEDIGTIRARANHITAPIHYYQEQIALKLSKTPL
jgi:hypothetical protein